MTDIVQFIADKRTNFAKFIKENLLNQSKSTILDEHLTMMTSIHPTTFLIFISSKIKGLTDDDIIAQLLTLVGLKEDDFNTEARPKFIQYLRMFQELAE